MKEVKSDDVLKEYWSNKERFADLCNAVLFEGRMVIHESDLQDSDTTLATTVQAKAKADVYSVTRYADVLKVVKNQLVLAILGIENQDKIHYAMPIRIMLNQSLGYVRQCKSITQKNQQQSKEFGNKAVFDNSDEFLSGMKKTDRILPIITIVMYYGEKEWDGPLALSDMIDEPELYKPFFSNYKMNLIHARNFAQTEFLHTNTKQFFRFLHVANSKEALKQYLSSGEADELDVESICAVAAAVHSKRILNMVKGKKKDEVIDMCTALEELIEEREGLVTIHLCRQLNLSDTDTVKHLKDELEITDKKAWEYIRKEAEGNL